MSTLTRKYDKSSRKYGFVDVHGNLVVPYVYTSTAFDWSEGFIYVDRGKWKGFLNASADEAISLEGYRVDNPETMRFEKGVCQVSKIVGSRICYGYIDKTGREVVPVVYDKCQIVGKGVFLIVDKADASVIFADGSVVSLNKYSEVGAVLSNGYISVGLEGKYGLMRWGCVDRYGDMKVPAIYDKILWGSGDSIGVVKDGVTGSIDKNGVFTQYKPTSDVDKKLDKALDFLTKLGVILNHLK